MRTNFRNIMTHTLKLEIQNGTYGVCKLLQEASIPSWAQGNFVSVTRTDEELSVVCREDKIPAAVTRERGWRIIKVLGPLDFVLTGILASLAEPLAEAEISIFAISTFDTDYVLVKNEDMDKAIEALSAAGHIVKKNA